MIIIFMSESWPQEGERQQDYCESQTMQGREKGARDFLSKQKQPIYLLITPRMTDFIIVNHQEKEKDQIRFYTFSLV